MMIQDPPRERTPLPCYDVLKSSKFTGRVKIERITQKKWFRTIETYRCFLQFHRLYDRTHYQPHRAKDHEVSKLEWHEISYKEYLKYVEDNVFKVETE